MTAGKTIRLRPLAESESAVIHSWPPYSGDMAQMDYALRQNGWLEEFWAKPNCLLYSASEGDELVGFTMLIGTDSAEAEFRIGLRADRTGRGLGAEIALQTLRLGFGVHGLNRIHLIVRTNNFRGLTLYRRLGFVEQGACCREIGGIMVDFLRMGIDRDDFQRRHSQILK